MPTDELDFPGEDDINWALRVLSGLFVFGFIAVAIVRSVTGSGDPN